MKINTLYRNGILQLVCLIIFILLLIVVTDFVPNHKPQFTLDTETQNAINKQQLAFEEQQKKIGKTYYVNYINDYTAYKLGLNTSQIDRFLAFRKTGKLIYSIKDFVRITQIDSLTEKKIEKQLRFPKTKFHKKNNYKKRVYTNKSKRFDLNLITETQLKKEFKFPDFVVKRIIKFRKYLNGYRIVDQIEDVYGILPYQVDKIKRHCFLKNPPKELKNIHTLSQKELFNVPYISWNTSKQIINYVKNNGKLTSFEILRKIEGFSTDKINRLPLYLTLN